MQRQLRRTEPLLQLLKTGIRRQLRRTGMLQQVKTEVLRQLLKTEMQRLLRRIEIQRQHRTTMQQQGRLQQPKGKEIRITGMPPVHPLRKQGKAGARITISR